MTILFVVSLARNSVDMKTVSPVDRGPKQQDSFQISWVGHTK